MMCGCFQYMRWDSIFAIIPVCVACVGIVLTIATLAIFVKHQVQLLVHILRTHLTLGPFNFYLLFARDPRKHFCYNFPCWPEQRFLGFLLIFRDPKKNFWQYIFFGLIT